MRKPSSKINIISTVALNPNTSTADTASLEDCKNEKVNESEGSKVKHLEVANVKYIEDAFIKKMLRQFSNIVFFAVARL